MNHLQNTSLFSLCLWINHVLSIEQQTQHHKRIKLFFASKGNRLTWQSRLQSCPRPSRPACGRTSEGPSGRKDQLQETSVLMFSHSIDGHWVWFKGALCNVSNDFGQEEEERKSRHDVTWMMWNWIVAWGHPSWISLVPDAEVNDAMVLWSSTGWS